MGSRKTASGGEVAAGTIDLMLDTLAGLLTGGDELVVGQADSLLIVANSTRVAERIATRLTGGALPALGDLGQREAVGGRSDPQAAG